MHEASFLLLWTFFYSVIAVLQLLAFSMTFKHHSFHRNISELYSQECTRNTGSSRFSLRLDSRCLPIYTNTQTNTRATESRIDEMKREQYKMNRSFYNKPAHNRNVSFSHISILKCALRFQYFVTVFAWTNTIKQNEIEWAAAAAQQQQQLWVCIFTNNGKKCVSWIFWHIIHL